MKYEDPVLEQSRWPTSWPSIVLRPRYINRRAFPGATAMRKMHVILHTARSGASEMNFIDRIQEFQRAVKAANRPVPRITVAVTEKYARKTLGLPSDAALIYNGVPLRCIGSKAWRARQAEIGGG